ncbi:hypothetical protein ABIA10_006744, partial [Rhizobium leguminosarum]
PARLRVSKVGPSANEYWSVAWCCLYLIYTLRGVARQHREAPRYFTQYHRQPKPTRMMARIFI